MTARRKLSRPRGRAAGAVLCPGLPAAMASAGVTQDALAASLRVARSTVGSWVRRGTMPATSLERAAAVLGVSPAVLEQPCEPAPAKVDYRAAALDVLARVLERMTADLERRFDGDEHRALDAAAAGLEEALLKIASEAP